MKHKPLIKYNSIRNACVLLILVFSLTNCKERTSATAIPQVISQENWPMASGPNGNWTSTTDYKVPTSWSVSTGKNIKWKTVLPEGGQSGIAIWGDKLFLTINELIPEGSTEPQPASTDIIAYCINANTGKVEWTANIPGIKERKHSGLFSDNTSPTPVTNGKYVWFVNAGGTIACFDMDGNSVWSQSFEMRARHAAKQCEPMLVDGQILYMALRDKGDPLRKGMDLPEGANKESFPEASMWPWTYIRSFDAMTGELLWTESSGTSVHNTPSTGTVGGNEVVFHVRGGGHAPPETPYGFTMTHVSGDKAGEPLWNYECEEPLAFSSMHFNEKYAYGIQIADGGSLLKFESGTGKLLQEFPLYDSATAYEWDTISNKYKIHRDVAMPEIIERHFTRPTNHTPIIAGEYLLFLTWRGQYIGRVNTETGKEEYLQVPVQVKRQVNEQDSILWSKHIPGDTRNSRGLETTDQKRTKYNGWGNYTPGCPIVINDYVFFSTMLGITYVIDTQSEVFDESAIIAINDLGPAGETWSLTSPSYANGKMFHRGLKYIVCIASDE